MSTDLELLSPAGSAEIGIAAINHGADAVYIGAPKFSARAQAGADLKDISRLIRHAHFYRAKVYVALNTMLTDAELSESREMIHQVYDAGADGLIIQDMGILELDLPPIPLIASTQMHNTTPEKIKFLQDIGFWRVILARELSLAEIAGIRKITAIGLEAFVHGALCVSYSGQCYMSQAVAGRSGNRGRCVQPCRSHYTLFDADGNMVSKDQYLLSLRDMNRLSAIPDLISAGVTSFKIEGRYKSIHYVKNVTAAYRLAIDRFIATHHGYSKASSGINAFSFEPDVERTFNRGYTDYYLSETQAKIASLATQKSIGKRLGTITAVGKNHFLIDTPEIHNGDGLCFFTKDGKLSGCRVQRADGPKIIPNTMRGLAAGLTVNRNADQAFEKVLNQSTGERRIRVLMRFEQDENNIRLFATDEDEHQVRASVALPFALSRNPVDCVKRIEKQLARSGNTPYIVLKIEVVPKSPGFIPVGMLNSLRRNVLDQLTRIRQESDLRQTIPFVPNSVAYPEKILDYRANVANSRALAFYKRHGAMVIEPAFEYLSDHTGKTVMTTRYCIRYQLDLCSRSSPGQTIQEPLRIRDAHHTYRLHFDCDRCTMSVILES